MTMECLQILVYTLCIYGDPAYCLRVHLQGLFKNGVLTQPMKNFNQSMSVVRTSVE